MNAAVMSSEIAAFWERFHSRTGMGGTRPFDVFSIGNSAESADAGLWLILAGEKTATSCLPEEFTDSRPPQAGDFSIVTDGSGQPCAVVETLAVIATPFNEVDAPFAHAYGEWDRTLDSWRKNNAAYYKSLCDQMGLEWHEKRVLLCETFRLVYPLADV